MTRSANTAAAALLLVLLVLACTLPTLTPVAASSSDTEIEVELATPAASGAAITPSSSLPDFIPTSEWAEVAEGQAIPPGLWVRMDLSSGKKMARLLPEEEKNDAARKLDASRAAAANELALVPEESESAPAESGGPLIRELPLPGEGTVPLDESSDASLDTLMSARAARLALLKSHFYLKEDVEMMKQLLALCIDVNSSPEQVMDALESLEEYLHQIDNARDWAKIGGMDVSLTLLQQSVDAQQQEGAAVASAAPVVSDADSNNTASGSSAVPAPLDLQRYRLMNLQAHAAWVLGTAAQNNLDVQEAARKEGAVSIVAELFRNTMAEQDRERSSASAQSEDTTAVSLFQLRASRLKLLSKLLYALSALLRNNARTQSIFHRSGALPLLKQEIHEDWPRCLEPPAATAPVQVDAALSIEAQAALQSSAAAAAAAATASSLSPLHCLSPSEAASLSKLASTTRLKCLNLVHDFVLDHTLNSQEIRSASGETIAANKAASDPALFAELTTKGWCEHYLARAVSPEGGSTVAAAAGGEAPSPSVLHTREQALEILSALMSHDTGLCVHALSSPASVASTVEQHLRGVEQQHARWAAQAEAEARAAADGDDADADGSKAKYHEELREAAASIRAKIANAADTVQAVQS